MFEGLFVEGLKLNMEFLGLQARRQEALLHSAPPNDPAWNAQLEKERQEEIKVITDACAAMGAELHEVGETQRLETMRARLMRECCRSLLMDIACSTPLEINWPNWD